MLLEVGRVTIAGSRLDVQMGLLWHHLDRSVDNEVTRKAKGATQCEQVRRRARERLTGSLQADVLAAVDVAEASRAKRNEIVHQDWLLHGRAAMRPVAELALIDESNLAAYLDEWERESNASQDWQRVPAHSMDVVPAQTVEELRRVEREIAAATMLVSQLIFRVASSRETGRPPGYRHMPE